MDYASFAMQYVGTKQGSKQHKYIVDTYNTIKPLPRSYKVKYSDYWCATFASFVMLKCGAKNAPYECSVQKMWKLAKSRKQIVTSPKRNDLIIYDWGNNGSLDHVGIITAVNGNTLTVVEGNKSKTVGVRTISKSSKEIEGYIRVAQTESHAYTYEEMATRVIKGLYGNGSARKKAIESAGYDYKKVQNIVNSRLKK